MKRTIKETAQFGFSVSRKKFVGLSSKKQHELIAAMAVDCLEAGAFSKFKSRYDQLQSWAELDRYEPPPWLSEKEMLLEFTSFHRNYTATSVLFNDYHEIKDQDLNWEASFDVSVMVDQIRSPFNVGSLLRIIDNFGFREFIHSTETLSLQHPQLKKSARGCERWIPVSYVEDPVKFLEHTNKPVIGLEKKDTGIEIQDWQPPASCILVAGNEEYGISDAILKRCSEIIEIPMFGYKKSMNVHHAVAIAAQRIVSGNCRMGRCVF